MTIIRKHILGFIGIVAGAAAVFAYWKFIGCASGSCPITSSPVNSSLYGAMMGGLLLNIIKDYIIRKYK